MTIKPRFIIALVSLSLLAAQQPYFTTDQLDPVAILPPPPAPGSAEEAIDLATTVAVHKSCNPADMAAAKSEEDIHVSVFTQAIGPSFQPDTLPATYRLLHRVGKTTGDIMHAAKSAFRRPRPYVLDPSLAEDGADDSYSYPSGHSMFGTVNALVLADLFPEKRDDILAVGRAIGWHRVQLAKHYPTDVYAGRVLALAIYHQLKANPDYQRDFAATKAELFAAATTRGATPQPVPVTPLPAAAPIPQPAPAAPQPALAH